MTGADRLTYKNSRWLLLSVYCCKICSLPATENPPHSLRPGSQSWSQCAGSSQTPDSWPGSSREVTSAMIHYHIYCRQITGHSSSDLFEGRHVWQMLVYNCCYIFRCSIFTRFFIIIRCYRIINHAAVTWNRQLQITYCFSSLQKATEEFKLQIESNNFVSEIEFNHSGTFFTSLTFADRYATANCLQNWCESVKC